MMYVSGKVVGGRVVRDDKPTSSPTSCTTR
jgi:hypothetical protein